MGILKDALALVGKVTYKYGANNIEGGVADCSAYTQYVFRKSGYEIGRDTRTQITKGNEVKFSNLKPGDLVFFEGTNPDREGVSHVGIYIGDGEMVNCQLTGGVAVANITSGYWKEHYMTARRVADASDVGSTGGPDAGKTETTGPVYGPENVTVVEPVSLEWWGDMIVIVMMILCLVGSVFFLYKAFETQIMEAVNPVKDLKKTAAKLLKELEKEGKKGNSDGENVAE